MPEFPRLTRTFSNSTSSTSNAPAGDGQVPTGNVGSRASSPPTASTPANQFSSIPCRRPRSASPFDVAREPEQQRPRLATPTGITPDSPRVASAPAHSGDDSVSASNLSGDSTVQPQSVHQAVLDQPGVRLTRSGLAGRQGDRSSVSRAIRAVMGQGGDGSRVVPRSSPQLLPAHQDLLNQFAAVPARTQAGHTTAHYFQTLARIGITHQQAANILVSMDPAEVQNLLQGALVRHFLGNEVAGRGADNETRDWASAAERAHLNEIHQNRPTQGLDDLPASRASLGHSRDPAQVRQAQGYVERLAQAHTALNAFITAAEDEREPALQEFRRQAREIESGVENDHGEGRISEGAYMAILEDLQVMFRRVPEAG